MFSLELAAQLSEPAPFKTMLLFSADTYEEAYQKQLRLYLLKQAAILCTEVDSKIGAAQRRYEQIYDKSMHKTPQFHMIRMVYIY